MKEFMGERTRNDAATKRTKQNVFHTEFKQRVISVQNKNTIIYIQTHPACLTHVYMQLHATNPDTVTALNTTCRTLNQTQPMNN